MAAEQAFKHCIRLLYKKADKLAAELEKIEAEIKAEQDRALAAGWGDRSAQPVAGRSAPAGRRGSTTGPAFIGYPQA